MRNPWFVVRGSWFVGFACALAGCVSFQDASRPEPCRPVVSVAGETPSLLPPGRDFALVWHDEFGGNALDDSKWLYRTNFWGKRAHWFAAPEDGCVEVKDGLLRLKIKKLANGQFVSPQLQTGELLWDFEQRSDPKGFWPYAKRRPPKFLHKYGYYECRCRLQQEPGWWSAFWMQTETQGCSLDPGRSGIEHDIMESFTPGEVIRHAFHYNGYGADYKGFHCPRDVDGRKAPDHVLDKTAFHVFGMLWEPDGYTFFIDGKQRGEKVGCDAARNEAVSHVPEFVLLTTECKWYRQNHMTGKGVPELEGAAAKNDAFIVDWVRVYDVVE